MKAWIWGAAVLALVGCGDDGGKDSSDTSEDTQGGHGAGGTHDLSTEVMSDGGSFMVSYMPSVDPIPLSEPFDLTVMVADATSGDMVMGADLTFAATMPDHGHGMNTEPAITANADGSFTVTGMLFHMEGWWMMTAGITVDSSTEMAMFNHTCCQ
ncbi:MAG: hypothetical protein ACI8PZ_000549 [Myxococcota bacterium]|jgi:hypothetical protein